MGGGGRKRWSRGFGEVYCGVYGGGDRKDLVVVMRFIGKIGI